MSYMCVNVDGGRSLAVHPTTAWFDRGTVVFIGPEESSQSAPGAPVLSHFVVSGPLRDTFGYEHFVEFLPRQFFNIDSLQLLSPLIIEDHFWSLSWDLLKLGSLVLGF